LTQFQTFFLSPFGEPSACEDLNHFLRSHRIVNVEKKMVDGERGTGWLFLIEYGQENKGAPQSAKDRVDYRSILSEQEYALFERLRQLRKETAEKHGVPVYAVFTNDQLAAMVKSPPKTLRDLQKLNGIGEGRVKQYGEVFFTLLAETGSSDHEESRSPF
jgi:superfamily II DNA helicase RecQ